MHKNITDFVNLGKYENANSKIKIAPKVVFLGDSITEDWYKHFPEFFIANNFANRGISGQITSQMLLRFSADVISLQPKYVFILGGINDIAENFGKMPLEMSLKNLAMMCDLAIANNIIPIISTLTPVNSFFWKPQICPKNDIFNFNENLKKMASEKKIQVLDLYGVLKDSENNLPDLYSVDGGHLTEQAYSLLNGIIVDYFKNI